MKKCICICLALFMLLLAGCQKKSQLKVIPIASLSPSATAQQSTEIPPTQPADQTPETTAPTEPVVSQTYDPDTIAGRFDPPEGYSRVFTQEGSFSAFLRQYPLAEEGAKVRLYNGETRADAGAAAVLNITLSSKNHEGPAGAMARLLAEYQYSAARYSAVRFTLGAQFDFSFDIYSEGKKLKVDGNSVKWESGGNEGVDSENFTAYLNTLFRYISVDSLKKDLTHIEDPDTDEIQPGDIFIGKDGDGKPICAMVADIAVNDVSGEKVMLLIEGGAPAQQAHIMENGANTALSPWYSCSFEMKFSTPDAQYDIEQRYRPKMLAQ